MTDHPCAGMDLDVREAFERIATNRQPACRWPVIDKLMRAGLIERESNEMRHDAMGVYYVPSFYVPIAVHAQWCKWCSEQP